MTKFGFEKIYPAAKKNIIYEIQKALAEIFPNTITYDGKIADEKNNEYTIVLRQYSIDIIKWIRKYKEILKAEEKDNYIYIHIPKSLVRINESNDYTIVSAKLINSQKYIILIGKMVVK